MATLSKTNNEEINEPRLIFFFFFNRISKFFNQSRKHIRNNVLSADETRKLAQQTASNILKQMKELGYSVPDDDEEEDDDDDDDDDDEEEVNCPVDAEQQEKQLQDDKEEEEEEEEEIHIYSDEENM